MKTFYLVRSISWLFLLITSIKSPAQTEKLRFEHITSDQGLPDNAALCSMQDSKGFLWFGTWNGLCKYDGYTFTTYQFDPNNTSSIGGIVITRIFEDRDGIIWVIAGIGIYLLDRSTEKFTRFNPKSDILSPRYSHSWELNEDKEGKIWTGNDEDGQLVRYDKQTGKLDDYASKIFPKQDLNAKKEHKAINSIYRAKDGTLWIGSSHGLHRLNLISQGGGKHQKSALLLTSIILKIQRVWPVITLVQYVKTVPGCFGLIAIV